MTTTSVEKPLEAARHPILLESPAQLEQAERHWQECRVLGVDTEFIRERTYRAELGLVQISDGETAWLLDPLALDSLQPLVRMMENPGILKVLHSSSEDLDVLLHSTGALPSPLVDTQVACAMLGQPLQMGYHAAVKWLFDIDVDKGHTRSNWLRRPLSNEQRHYAAMDVVLLPRMLEILSSRLRAKDRWSWLEEDSARLLKQARRTELPDRIYLRFRAAGKLDEPVLRQLRVLAAWRERTAQEKNLARGFVVSDAGLLAIARAMPAAMKDLHDIEGLHPRAADRYGKQILSLVREARNDREPLERPAMLDKDQQVTLKKLRQKVTSVSRSLDVDPALLASRKELERLIRARFDGRQPPERFLGWRKGVVTDELLEAGT